MRRIIRDRSGLTMIELMAAMAVLATLGAFLVRIIGTSFDLYDQGDVRGDVYQNGQALLEALEADLIAVHGGAEGRLVIERGRFGPGSLLIRLVRTAPGGEMEHPVLRKAGTEAGPNGVWNGDEPREGLASIAPPSGLIEVAWALLQDDADPMGVLTLYRGSRAPALEGVGSFFDPELEETMEAGWVRQRLTAVGTDVLGLWILGLGQKAEEWGEVEALGKRPASNGAYADWDSTRALLSRGQFPLAVGPESLADSRDDVFPRQIRIVVTVGRGNRPETQLAGALTSDANVIDLVSDQKLPPADPETDERLVKVGNEWIGLAGDGAQQSAGRGLRGTKPVDAVPAREPVFAGYTFRKTFRLPAAKSYWLSEDG